MDTFFCPTGVLIRGVPLYHYTDFDDKLKISLFVVGGDRSVGSRYQLTIYCGTQVHVVTWDRKKGREGKTLQGKHIRAKFRNVTKDRTKL